MLKWILLVVCFVLIGGCVALFGGIYWAYSSVQKTPDFYDEVKRVELTEEERAEKIAEFRALATTVAPPLVRSREDDLRKTGDTETASEVVATGPVRRTPEQSSESDNVQIKDDDSQQADLVEPTGETIPFQLELTEAQINAYIDSLIAQSGGQLPPVISDPRIRLIEGGAKIGVRVRTPEISGVVAVDVEPVIDGPKQISLLLKRISLGKLSIPVERAMMSANIRREDLPDGIEIPENASPPRVILSWDHLDVLTEVDSAEFLDGRVRADLTVPAPKPQTDDKSDPADSPAARPAA